MRTLISTQALFTAAIAIIALVIFNLNFPGVESDALVSFNKWYAETSPKLERGDAASLSNVKLNVSIGLINRPTPPPSLSWTLPARSLADASDRDNTARVLQLIHESGVFGQRVVTKTRSDISYLTISVRDGDTVFQTTVPAEEIEKSIQLQNLLKLLDIFSKTTPAHEIEPSRT